MRRLLSRLLDGPHRWGELRVAAGARGNWITYRLVVYPPGITPRDRRAMRLRLWWPLVGAVLGLVVLLLTGGVEHPLLISGGVLIGYLGVAAVLLRTTREVARATVRVSAAEVWELGRSRPLGEPERLRSAATALLRLDRSELDPVTYERAWWAVYDALSAEPSGSRRPA